MAVRKPKEIEAGLSKKGFLKESGGRHTLYRLWVEGKKTGITTAVSAKEEYTKDLLMFMRKGLRLDTNQELLNLIDCPMSEKEYLDKLRTKNLKI